MSSAEAQSTDVAPPPSNLDAILSIPVSVQVVLGGTSMPVSHLMKLSRGAVIPLDQRVGQPVDIVVNGRVIARGDMVVIEDNGSQLGVSLTEVVGLSPRS
jgi:flagellar motor switch protein FliN